MVLTKNNGMDKGLHILQPLLGIGLISTLFASFNFAVKWLYRQHPVSVEYERKIMHLVVGACLLTLPWLFHTIWAVLILVSVLVVGPYLVHSFSWTERVFGRTLAVQRKNIGGPLFGLAFLILFILADHHRTFYLVSGLIVVFADAAAAMIGSKAPWLPYRIMGHKKSTSGSIAFFLVAFFCCLIPLMLMSNNNAWLIVQASVIVSLSATLVEACSPFGSDNLTVPIFVYYLLYYMLGT